MLTQINDPKNCTTVSQKQYTGMYSTENTNRILVLVFFLYRFFVFVIVVVVIVEYFYSFSAIRSWNFMEKMVDCGVVWLVLFKYMDEVSG